ncbi:ubiquitin-conjugating enzyme E2 J2-like [Penaeus monodon]|uniref:ubiquitin-conjugating enzyme E2 J2-like n=2 Tax=Penaeus TaxID=133894 RepID=UPI0018A6F87B|nr:ubiquitin-conjugating enzyme E2 J2-like [Penaeus monodon]XP_037787247.1 ubiquitin-conjugating enzyme E2 J2-like [Penaeus monodon]XP_047497465.1 ubiquitin-conjugating enzyme E2 J2-like [Penaeus chinensis]XP_047497466.1 ubiquitin-conjugating enzyme E2 J2-like [Penaeus chinensis]XP_047497467.1 ubiquitin-conjugating enzyme E2 J2-like [Penaeus chinensis]XP_047497468.1 ubiquitin-conjugating enzyme E2 J2-like [Penaeus chinensis]
MSKHSGTASARLRADYMRLKRDPVPYVTADPLPSNILEWHYVVEGPEQSPYEGGYYHGKLVFPMEYPFRPPSIYMITPSGRFKTNTRLCLSISDFHPDTWNPAWSVATILTGLLSFMLEKAPTFGSIETSDYEKRQLAQQSLSFNLKDKVFTELFPEITETIQEKLAQREQELAERAKAIETGSLSEKDRTNSDSGNQNLDASHMSALTNLLVVVGFALFAWTVKYVMSTLSDNEG